jgi:hypothetical protein
VSVGLAAPSPCSLAQDDGLTPLHDVNHWKQRVSCDQSLRDKMSVLETISRKMRYAFHRYGKVIGKTHWDDIFVHFDRDQVTAPSPPTFSRPTRRTLSPVCPIYRTAAQVDFQNTPRPCAREFARAQRAPERPPTHSLTHSLTHSPQSGGLDLREFKRAVRGEPPPHAQPSASLSLYCTVRRAVVSGPTACRWE